jgi:hypothetical protein
VTRNRQLLLLAAALAVGAAIDVVVGYSPFPGYGALIGVVGTLLITAGSSGLTRLAARPEDHYADERPRDLEEDLRSDAAPLPGAPGAPDPHDSHDPPQRRGGNPHG